MTGIEIDLNTTWAKDWEWMQHCVEIAEDFQSKGLQELISTFSDQGLNLLRSCLKGQRVELMNYILQDTQRIYTE
jgi:hypothetical protein